MNEIGSDTQGRPCVDGEVFVECREVGECSAASAYILCDGNGGGSPIYQSLSSCQPSVSGLGVCSPMLSGAC